MSDPIRPVCVYGLYDSRDPEQRVRYVGVTGQPPLARLSQHRRGAARLDRLMTGWLDEHTAIRELEQCAWAARHERESEWIIKLETLTSQGGFNDALGARPSAATRGKFSEAQRRLAESSEHSERLSAGQHRRYSDPQAREAIGNENRRRWSDPEYTARVTAAQRVGAHRRWHVARGIVKSGCELCEKS